MKPDVLRPLISIVGLAVGFVLYRLAHLAPEPWPRLLVGAMFVALGVGAWRYARGERWIQGLAALLLGYGVIRMFLN